MSSGLIAMSLGLIDIQRSLLTGYRRAHLVALGEERRRGQRFEAVVKTAILGWWVGKESHIRPAHLVNISRGGALLLAAEVPREMERASFALSSDRENRWISGTAIGSALDASGEYLLHFKFDLTCPDAVFGLALGLAASGGPHGPDPGDSDESLSAVSTLTMSAEFEIDLDLACPCPETSEFACFDAADHERLAKISDSSAARIR
jgi:hypothetical protein